MTQDGSIGRSARSTVSLAVSIGSRDMKPRKKNRRRPVQLIGDPLSLCYGLTLKSAAIRHASPVDRTRRDYFFRPIHPWDADRCNVNLKANRHARLGEMHPR
jgi:hypothetical protein